MAEIKLRGFNDLDESEVMSIQDLVSKRLKKLKVDYNLLSIELQQHKHSKRFIHEINASLFLGTSKAISASVSDDNLYKALDCVMEKLTSEIEHKLKK
jgi:ribosome-associated translation inhibitor RaiA